MNKHEEHTTDEGRDEYQRLHSYIVNEFDEPEAILSFLRSIQHHEDRELMIKDLTLALYVVGLWECQHSGDGEHLHSLHVLTEILRAIA